MGQSKWSHTERGRLYKKFDKFKQKIRRARGEIKIKFRQFEHWYKRISNCQQCNEPLSANRADILIRCTKPESEHITIIDLKLICITCYINSLMIVKQIRPAKVNTCNKCGV